MKLTFKEYVRGLLIFQSQAARASLYYGIKGIYLGAVCYVFRSVPINFTLRPFGKMGLYNECLSIFDNFIEGELRSEKIESEIINSTAPVIVDLGINLGITVRWWFSLNKNASVYGIDMIPETLEFTSRRLLTIPGSFMWTGISAAISDKKETYAIQYDDPLEGSNSILGSEGKIQRTVQADTLDNLLLPYKLSSVTLIKIDIEGYGAIALRKADQLLAKAKYIILETHSESEISEANKILVEKGWELFVVKGRSAFFRNPALLAK